MYLVLRAPWRDAPAAVAVAPPPDAGPGSAAPGKKKGKRPRRTASGEPAPPSAEDTEETEPVVLTLADRKLEWRGDTVTMPPKTIDMGDGKETRSLSDGEISGTINRRGDGVLDCIQRAAMGTELVATVTLKMIVDGNGTATKLRIHAPRYLFEEGLQGCAKRAVAKFDFPATGQATLVTAPFELGR